MKIVFVRPLRLSYHITNIRNEYRLDATDDVAPLLKSIYMEELEKPVEDMSPIFLDLMELLLETLLSYGINLDFFSVVALEHADEMDSLLIKVL